MQLDAEEDDQAFYKPPVEPSARPSTSEASEHPAAAVPDEDDD